MNQEEFFFSYEDQEKSEIYSVGELTRSIRFVLEEEFATVWVWGEISNYRLPQSGHAYFILKDEESQIRCVLFRGQRNQLRFDPEDGMEVLLKGRISVYSPRGEYQIIADTLEPRGMGALQIAFEKLKEKLQKEGLFDKEKKKPLPPFPGKIGIVTSPTGAAIRDMLNVLGRRSPGTPILLSPAKVQGEGAGAEVARGIEILNKHGEVDIIIIGRGGGSMEDLWAFNEEVVARAIARSPIPIVSAVGHEVDFTIADFVADLRAPTPSAAAELIVADRKELLRRVGEGKSRMASVLFQKVRQNRESLRRLAQRRVLKDPFAPVRDFQQRVDELQGRLNRSVLLISHRKRDHLKHLAQKIQMMSPTNRISQSRKILLELSRHLTGAMRGSVRVAENRLKGAAGRLNALSPLGVLERGYSICQKTEDGKVVRRSTEVLPGEKVDIRLGRGKLRCEVLKNGGNEV